MSYSTMYVFGAIPFFIIAGVYYGRRYMDIDVRGFFCICAIACLPFLREFLVLSALADRYNHILSKVLFKKNPK